MSERIFRLVKEVIDKSKKSNVCIYGNNGCGKTTLLKEVHKALNNSIYIDSEDLIDEFEILGQTVFKLKYNEYEYLIIDNISILPPRKNLFNTIQTLNKRIISSSPIMSDIPNVSNVNIKTKTDI